MVATRETTLQRIGLGVFGIVLVLMIVSIVNIMSEPGQSASDIAAADEEPGLQKSKKGEVGNEPLTELGIAPAVDGEVEKKKEKPLPQSDLDGPNIEPID